MRTITSAQAYALSIIDRTPDEKRNEMIDYLCDNLSALGNPPDETQRIRTFLESELQEMRLTRIAS